MLALVAQLQPTLYDPPNFCSPPSSSAHGILQAKTLEWLNILFSRDLSNPGIEPGSPILADSLPSLPFFTREAFAMLLHT